MKRQLDTTTTTTELQLFQPLRVRISTTFWTELARRKLDEFKLSEDAVPVRGFYRAGSPFLELDNTSFGATDAQTSSAQVLVARGVLHLCNTAEQFRTADKRALLAAFARAVDAEPQPAAHSTAFVPARFLLVAYADLKKHDFTYLVAVLALRYKRGGDALALAPLAPVAPTALAAPDAAALAALASDPSATWAFLPDAPDAPSGDTTAAAAPRVRIAVKDPADDAAHPGWPLRLLLAHIARHVPGAAGAHAEVLCLRACPAVPEAVPEAAPEAVPEAVPEALAGDVRRLEVRLPRPEADEGAVGTGWEPSDVRTGAVHARTVSLAAQMDPRRLAENAVDLNLKLMRWRMFTDLDLARVAGTRCLLLGAGTLGCNVARGLVGWGVRHITFVDNARVAYSNPVRQSLFTFADCLDGGRPKAEAAAARLRDVFPGVETRACVMTIPMPGHYVSPADAPRVRRDCDTLAELVRTHDAIFLLSDSRECRWLPTVLGAAQRKLVITVGLGFDSYVVMRHGVAPTPDPAAGTKDLGCYFCSDVVAPRDSLTDRTLDQACTVTRPGVSMVAAAYACELLVSVLHHPQGALAPANGSCALGSVPHQLRGFLSQWSNMALYGASFDRCVACSNAVVREYLARGFDFLLEVFNNPTYLEAVSGITAMRLEENVVDGGSTWVTTDTDDF